MMQTLVEVAVAILLCAMLLALLVGLIRLQRAHAQLRQDVSRVLQSIAGQRQDLAGISAAGVNVDRLLIEQDKRLRDCMEKMETLHMEQLPAQPYHAAIERIRQGARAEELAAEFGMSLSEASLLIRVQSAAR